MEAKMPRRFLGFALALTAATAACGRGPNRSADTSLNTDLSLAAQQRGNRSFDSLSAAERSAATGVPSKSMTRTTTSTSGGEVARPRRSTSSAGSRPATTATTTTTTRSSGGTVEKHTNRDAAIGAAAGAVIGATTSRNKVKGGLIGAAVGGILGGVVGNNVDKKKKP
jgi:hypothetical protein